MQITTESEDVSNLRSQSGVVSIAPLWKHRILTAVHISQFAHCPCALWQEVRRDFDWRHCLEEIIGSQRK